MTIKESLHAAAMVLLCAVLLGSALFVFRLPKIINHQADQTRAELLASEHIAEQDAISRIGIALDMIDRRSGEVLAEAHRAARNADARTSEALDIARQSETDANHQLTTFNGTLTTQMSGIVSALKPITETAQQLDDAAPLWLDCDFNPDCAFNRYQGVAKAIETTAIVISAETPKMTANADKIATSSVGIADSIDATGKEVKIAAKRFNAPQTKWQAFRMWLLTAARIAGDF